MAKNSHNCRFGTEFKRTIKMIAGFKKNLHTHAMFSTRLIFITYLHVKACKVTMFFKLFSIENAKRYCMISSFLVGYMYDIVNLSCVSDQARTEAYYGHINTSLFFNLHTFFCKFYTLICKIYTFSCKFLHFFPVKFTLLL